MLNQFQKSFSEIISIIEQNEYNKLNESSIEVPEKFNWIRDVFEPLIVHAHADRNMIELVADNQSEAITITYKQGSEKCNQLLNFLRKQNVQQGDDIFIMCGLNEGLWISYLAAIKGGLILIPAASILTVNDIVYRFQKASPKVIIADKDNAEKLEQALLQYDHPVKVRLLLDGEKDGWISYNVIDKEEKEAIAADTNKDDDLFWFFTSGNYRNAKGCSTYSIELSFGTFNHRCMDRVKSRR
jgi:acetyl-CoA synthetase